MPLDEFWHFALTTLAYTRAEVYGNNEDLILWGVALNDLKEKTASTQDGMESEQEIQEFYYDGQGRFEPAPCPF
jgi:hypothetical protein